MIRQTTITIGGEDFLITTMAATRGLKVLKQLTKLLGPSFSELVKGGDEVNPVAIAIEKLFDNLDSVDVEDLVKTLATSATKGSVSINFDTEFAGDYAKLFTLVKEVVEFNFGNVFTLFGSEVGV